jgi:hypothetical protein
MRVPDIVTKCVAFILFMKKGSDALSYAGTCFLVHYPLSNTPNRAMGYMVTARHVIAYITENSDDGKVFIRANRADGRIETFDGHVSDFFVHPCDTSVDVAVCKWAPSEGAGADLTRIRMDLVPVPIARFTTREELKDQDVGPGDEVFCTGLFSRFVGTAKNMPIVRMGTVALMPDEPIPTTKFGNMEAILVEVRSVGGLSGSPVFLYSVGPRFTKAGIQLRGALFSLCGLMHGHWETEQSVVKVDVPFEREKLNLGIAVVVPAYKITEVLDCPELQQHRAELDAAFVSDAALQERRPQP